MPVSRAANSGTFHVSTPSDREIALTRLFDAPRELLFEALTEPRHISRWWGNLGEGYAVPVCEVDLRPGGRWRFVNRHPHGEAEFHGVYREIAPPDRLVYTEVFAPFPEAESIVTVTLSDEDGKTRLTVVAAYPSLEVRDQVLQTGMERGAGLSYDRLDDLLRDLN